MKYPQLLLSLMLVCANVWSGCISAGADAKQNFDSCSQAAKQGDASAQKDIGNLYTQGLGVAVNHEQAVSWYRKAAAQGNLDATYNLGVMYDKGNGVTKDTKQAAAWYRKAADQGDALAQYNLAVMYEYGEGVTQDYGQALALYQKAAEQGQSAAQFSMGLMYEKGLGVPRDPVTAYMWWNITGVGHEHAIHNRDSLAEELKPAQIEEAQGRSVAWRAARPLLSPPTPWNAHAN